MKNFRRFLSFFLVFIMMSSNVVFASESGGSTNSIILQNGIELSEKEFIEILNNYKPEEVRVNNTSITGSNTLQSRAAVAVVAVYFIPGIGEVALLATGAILLGGAVVVVGSWVYDAITSWLATLNDIPGSLKKPNGDVDLGKFNQKVGGSSTWKDPKTGWTIDKDTSGHGGSKWKLKDKKGNRKASLDENGKILRD